MYMYLIFVCLYSSIIFFKVLVNQGSVPFFHCADESFTMVGKWLVLLIQVSNEAP